MMVESSTILAFYLVSRSSRPTTSVQTHLSPSPCYFSLLQGDPSDNVLANIVNVKANISRHPVGGERYLEGEMERKVHDRPEDIIRGKRKGDAEWVGMRKRKKPQRGERGIEYVSGD